MQIRQVTGPPNMANRVKWLTEKGNPEFSQKAKYFTIEDFICDLTYSQRMAILPFF